ncbi:protein spire homolog 1 isoform X1 [Pangasianodon hypophthalmus]|uniref:protein spire homolog 1 isoform X1 n=1 Tax=Pangasianodon hypophthalmus TaxID=310915 RepID=UPI0023076D76|nr:protein spire homolog 1 isoform X1 [Pangasianodon hypophthalmus]
MCARRVDANSEQLMDASGPVAHAMEKEDADGEGDDLSLEEILTLYDQPINEEQAWAVCYQCCRDLSGSDQPRVVRGPGDVRIHKDGTVRLQRFPGKEHSASAVVTNVIESLGIMIYKALDYGLKEHEERELSPPLEQLIDLMTNMTELNTDPCPDEGYEATEDEEEEELSQSSGIRRFRDVLKLCTMHLPSPADAPDHYRAVCRALYAETMELRTFLEKIRSAKENLRKMEGNTTVDSARDLNELQNADWARFWVQVMRDLRTGVKLKKVQERQYNPLPIEFQLTPYEMLMDDIRAKRYTLRKVMVNGDIPPRLKKSAHEVILEFIRSRPPLNPVAARKLKPQVERPPSLHERILEEIKSERKLRPVSPDQIRRSRMVIRPLSMSQSFDSSDVSAPDAARKASSSLSLANGSSLQSNGTSGFQRKRLHAPTLSELGSSDSDDETVGQRSASSSSISTPIVEDTSPESAVGKKTPPMFLPISSTPQPERKQPAQRRHSIEKETPTNVRQFVPPCRQSSRSLEEFCFPVECLALTVEEVMHIRQVLVKAELEKFQQYKDIYNALKKGKLCFCCRTKRFSFFTWSYTCQFCKRPVCSQCCKKIRLPSKPYSSLPIYSLGPSTSTLSRDKSEKTSTSQRRPSLQRTMSRLSKSSRQSSTSSSREDIELPKELTEDWSTMEVCVDCKRFISDIISSSKHSISLATKRGRMKRKTHSFIASSATGSEYRPSERTIHEV